MESHSTCRKNDGSSSARDWKKALEIIEFGLPEQSIEGMKVVLHELALATSDPEGRSMDNLLKYTDRLVYWLASKLVNSFRIILAGASSRSCQYVLETLIRIFQNKRLALAVQEKVLGRLIHELLLWLMDERVPLMIDGVLLIKALNVLMLKILDNAEMTSSFVVLIDLLRPLDPSMRPSPPVNKESFAVCYRKFSRLIVKSLAKLLDVLQNTKCDVDLDRLLPSIHGYLQEYEMGEIITAGAYVKPQLMVKNVLNELVKLRGTAIKDHLSFVAKDLESQPIILSYIDSNLLMLDAARTPTPFGPVGRTDQGDLTTNNPSPATLSADAYRKVDIYSDLQNPK